MSTRKITLLQGDGGVVELVVIPGESLQFKQIGLEGFGIQGVQWWEDIEPDLMAHVQALQAALEDHAPYPEVIGKGWDVFLRIPAEEFGNATPFTREGTPLPHGCATVSIKIPLKGLELEVIPSESITFRPSGEGGQGIAGVLFCDTLEPGLKTALESLVVETQAGRRDWAAWNTWAAEAAKQLIALHEAESWQ